jgi:peptide/nickel transport system permease protein
VSAYVLRRILIAVPVLIGITLVAFIALSLAPGDPLLARLEPAQLQQLVNHPEVLAQRRHELGLDQPLFPGLLDGVLVPGRYFTWLGGALTGEFGYSVKSHQPVITEIVARVPPTLALMGAATLLAVSIGLIFGIVAAVRQYSLIDYILTTFTVAMASTPTFVLGLIGIYVFAVWIHVLPTNGMQTFGRPSSLLDFLTHLTLPALVLGLASAAPLLRYTRASMLDTLNSEYITTAKAKGLAPRLVTFRHAFRNSLIPIITIIGLLVPDLVAGAVITEQIFAWPGMGQLAVRAATDRDTALMMGIVLVVSFAVLATNIAVDILYATVDPRIRFGRSAT